MELKTTEFFKNIKNLPLTGTKEWFDLRDWERDKCLGGITVNGVFIPGWLYWHLNHWWIGLDEVDAFGNDIKTPGHPELRDNEWIISEGLEKAKQERKGLMIIGGRRNGKSEAEASYTMYNVSMFENTQNIIVGGDEGDLGILKAKIDFGNPRVWDGLQIPKLDNDWRRSMVRMGFKTKEGEDVIWSYIVLRNVNKGNNTEGPAGVTAKSYIGDEIAKYAFSQAFEAAKPSFMTKRGWGAVPLLAATGGNAEKFADAERYFYNPEANNFISYTHPETGEKTGLFLSGLYRPDCKIDTNLGDYLVSTGQLDSEKNITELKKIKISIADKEKALRTIRDERIQKAADPDQTEYLKQIMYFPVTPQECFLSTSVNFYNRDIAQKQKDKLEELYPGLKIGMYVELEEIQMGDDIKIVHKPSSRIPISTYPCKNTENKNTPIVILEHPLVNSPWGLYTAGVDPYRFEKAENSDSLGAVYIFKRMYDTQADSFQDMIVAWYVGRPDSKETWNNNARLLIEYYNAITLCENDEMSFIDYMISKDKGHFLLDTPEWLKEYIPNSSTMSRAKGISSAAPKVKELLRTNFKQYMEEVFTSIPVQGSSETRKLLGISKVNDPMLLEEVIKWNKDRNADREIACSLAITCARKLDAQKLKVSIETDDPRFLAPVNYGKNRRTTFKPMSHRPTETRLKKLFK